MTALLLQWIGAAIMVLTMFGALQLDGGPLEQFDQHESR
jgi:hypothetical protein